MIPRPHAAQVGEAAGGAVFAAVAGLLRIVRQGREGGFHRYGPAGHGEGVLPAALGGQLDLVPPAVGDGQDIQHIAAVRGDGQGNGAAAAGVGAVGGHFAVFRLLHRNGVGAGTPAPAAGVAAWIRLGIGLCGRLIADGHGGQSGKLTLQALRRQSVGQGFHGPGIVTAGNEVLDGEGVAGGPGPRRIGQHRRHAPSREVIGIDIAPCAVIVVLEGHIEYPWWPPCR